MCHAVSGARPLRAPLFSLSFPFNDVYHGEAPREIVETQDESSQVPESLDGGRFPGALPHRAISAR